MDTRHVDTMCTFEAASGKHTSLLVPSLRFAAAVRLDCEGRPLPIAGRCCSWLHSAQRGARGYKTWRPMAARNASHLRATAPPSVAGALTVHRASRVRHARCTPRPRSGSIVHEVSHARHVSIAQVGATTRMSIRCSRKRRRWRWRRRRRQLKPRVRPCWLRRKRTTAPESRHREHPQDQRPARRATSRMPSSGRDGSGPSWPFLTWAPNRLVRRVGRYGVHPSQHAREYVVTVCRVVACRMRRFACDASFPSCRMRRFARDASFPSRAHVPHMPVVAPTPQRPMTPQFSSGPRSTCTRTIRSVHIRTEALGCQAQTSVLSPSFGCME